MKLLRTCLILALFLLPSQASAWSLCHMAVSSGSAPTLVLEYQTYSNVQSGVVVTTGQGILVGYSYNAALAGVTCSDNSGGGTNTYNQIGTGINVALHSVSGHVFYAIAKASETLTITCTTEADQAILVHVITGNNTTLASVLDTSSTLAETSDTNSHVGNNISTGYAKDYLFSFWYAHNNTDTVTENGQSFVKQGEITGIPISSFDRIVTSTGTYHDAITGTANNAYGNFTAAFKGQ